MRTSLVLALFVSGCAPYTQQFAPPYKLKTDRAPEFGVSGDLNGDGRADLVVTRDWPRGEVRVLLGKGDGTFDEKSRLVAIASPRSPVLRDFNGDGKLDMAILGFSSQEYVNIFLGNGDGSFEESTRYVMGPAANHLRSLDLNGDGKLDLVSISTRLASDPGAVGVTLNGRLVVSLGNGDGTFTPANMLSVDGQPRALAVGDWDGDKVPDAMVAVLHNTRSSIVFYRGRGDGHFDETSQIWHTPFEVVGISAPADLNKDGVADLIVGVPSGESIFIGEGGGKFHYTQSFNTDVGRAAWIADFDKDGNLDIVTPRRYLRGDGTGHFTVFALAHEFNNDSSLDVGDYNNDGWLDVAATDTNRNDVDVYLNRGGSAAR